MPTESEFQRAVEMILGLRDRVTVLEEWRRSKEGANTRSAAWIAVLLPVAVGILGLLLQAWLYGGRP